MSSTPLARLALLAAAGAAGTLLRFWIGSTVNRLVPGLFPWGTLVVNVLGCLWFGLIWTLAERLAISEETRFFVLVGFMGAFTTFSTFAGDTGMLLRDAHWRVALTNVLAENGLGIIAFFAGSALARLV